MRITVQQHEKQSFHALRVGFPGSTQWVVAARNLCIVLLFIYGSLQINAQNQIATDGENIGLLIVGMITQKDKDHENVALIKEIGSGKVEAVKKGFKIMEQYVVTEVSTKYIVVQSANKKYLVYQSKFAGEFAKGVSTSEPLVTSAYSAGSNYSEDGFERAGNKITLTAAYREKMLNEDLPKILMQATAIPKVVDGQIVGFRVLQIDKGSIYDKAGLQNEDVVTAINGNRLNNVAGAIKLLKSMRGQGNIQVELERGGAKQTVELNVAH